MIFTLTASLAILQSTQSNTQKTASAPKIQIVDQKTGTGEAVVRGDQVTVDYVGKFTNGKIFDQSKGNPFTVIIGLGNVIKGWDQGLSLIHI